MTDISSPSKPSLLNWLEVVALGIIWGGSFLSVRIALDGMQPLWIATGRIALAALTLGALSMAMGLRLPPLAERKVWLHALGFAVFSNALPFTLIAWAQTHVQSSFVGITMALVPLFTLVLAHGFLPGERLTLSRMAGVALGLVGVVVLIGVGALDMGSNTLDKVARIACIGVTLSYSVGSIITRRSPRVDPIAFSTAALILAGMIMVPLTFAVEGVCPRCRRCARRWRWCISG
ncbi:DMT family transporter [Pararhodobacter zhoushanensis]|uniref:DMT family transporter n=1 Tax=Pararhodobacter zhoushanensis TaxID=2479545 RepID=A0ABT3H3R7_9RHOB|nr:DMT family transporter [Pararhodobacter zhoushanensis]MCW1934469.1 DMT family transporter [Pararhodobacter zhoushanensis]